MKFLHKTLLVILLSVTISNAKAYCDASIKDVRSVASLRGDWDIYFDIDIDSGCEDGCSGIVRYSAEFIGLNGERAGSVNWEEAVWRSKKDGVYGKGSADGFFRTCGSSGYSPCEIDVDVISVICQE